MHRAYCNLHPDHTLLQAVVIVQRKFGPCRSMVLFDMEYVIVNASFFIFSDYRTHRDYFWTGVQINSNFHDKASSTLLIISTTITNTVFDSSSTIFKVLDIFVRKLKDKRHI